MVAGHPPPEFLIIRSAKVRRSSDDIARHWLAVGRASLRTAV